MDKEQFEELFKQGPESDIVGSTELSGSMVKMHILQEQEGVMVTVDPSSNVIYGVSEGKIVSQDVIEDKEGGFGQWWLRRAKIAAKELAPDYYGK